ncbi:hypothetical protein J6590_017297 [Homalodisca vitripennis]|nr:hypothetical protein J6590_017297 [Homalodisca vitripennis]
MVTSRTIPWHVSYLIDFTAESASPNDAGGTTPGTTEPHRKRTRNPHPVVRPRRGRNQLVQAPSLPDMRLSFIPDVPRFILVRDFVSVSMTA